MVCLYFQTNFYPLSQFFRECLSKTFFIGHFKIQAFAIYDGRWEKIIKAEPVLSNSLAILCIHWCDYFTTNNSFVSSQMIKKKYIIHLIVFYILFMHYLIVYTLFYTLYLISIDSTYKSSFYLFCNSICNCFSM